tara:strand:+ start:403 stop:1248 length:846 start_codon:yes stop_codon:yes gene_type:complete
MIIWIASYPKSGNTWLRSLLSSYFFSKNGVFNFNQLDNIKQFSCKNLNSSEINSSNYQTIVSKNWIPTQEIINKDKKIHFLKTHNAICSINGNSFTNQNNTIAAIYIIRDPRNVITSISNHYNLSLQDSLEFIKNKKKIIFPNKKKINNHDDFNFISNWSDHYSSWKNINFAPIKIIKYEDLTRDTNKTFISILEFLSKFIKFNFDKSKIKNSIDSTTFDKLAEMEREVGFAESSDSTLNSKKIRFFHLGNKNTWSNLLDKNVSHDIDDFFKKEMKTLGYL